MLHKNIKTRILTVFVCAASIMLSGCTSFGLFLANLPASFEKDQMIDMECVKNSFIKYFQKEFYCEQ